MAHELGLDVVAEGVETPEEAVALRDLGSDLLQGCLFSGPVPASELTQMLRAGHASRIALDTVRTAGAASPDPA